MLAATVVMYTTLMCPFCVRAKELLHNKGITINEIRVDEDRNMLEEMMRKSSGRRTVPQIFINEHHVGGFDDLKALNESGELDKLLSKES